MSTSSTAADAAGAIPAPIESSQLTLVAQLVQWGRHRIDERVFRPGLRMPSIRRLAIEKNVSRFTVVEAYERLVALGYLEARRGSGFYVRDRAVAEPPPARLQPAPHSLDLMWLVRNMTHSAVSEKSPGLGYVPNRWLDGELLASALRALARQSGAQLLHYGTPNGFAPLRTQLQTRLGEMEIGAAPDQIVTVSGVTQALDLIARQCLQPGDSVIVGDPAWFQMFGCLASHGARLLALPYTPAGPDLDVLEDLARTWRPKLLLINSVLQNPTGTSLTAAQAFRILQLAETYDFRIIEDDIYCDMCPPGYPATRLASLDQLKRVVYLGSFSKTLSANLRVGYVAADPEFAKQLADLKMLLALCSPEINERLLFKVLTEGHYRRHIERLRERLDSVREKAARALERVGFSLFGAADAGMFLWANAHVDTGPITAAGHEQGFLFAPGSLFSPYQAPSTWMRFNIANSTDPALLQFLARQLDRTA